MHGIGRVSSVVDRFNGTTAIDRLLPIQHVVIVSLSTKTTSGFGFSIGNFIAGLNLLHNVVMALRNANGAKSQYNTKILDLENI